MCVYASVVYVSVYACFVSFYLNFNFFKKAIYIWIDILPTCLFSTACGPSACGGYKRVSDALEVKLQLVLSCLTRETRELNSCPLEEHSVLFTAKPSLSLTPFIILSYM